MSLLLAALLFAAPCTPVIDAHTVALRTAGFGGAPGWTDYEVTVTLKKREVSGTRAEDAVKQVFHRSLSAAEVNALVSQFSRTCLASTDEAAPDGGARFEALESDGGVRQVLLSKQLAFELTDVFPWPDSPRPPVVLEETLVTFIKEALGGTPFGPPDVRWSFARLDPKYFELREAGPWVLKARPGAGISAMKLSTAMNSKPARARGRVLGYSKTLEPVDDADAPIQIVVDTADLLKARVEQIILRTTEP